MGSNRRVLQIVGYSNSGKTTLMEKVIAQCTKELGWDVATIKHHGHQGDQLYSENGKDSDRHLKAGAKVTAVEGGGEMALHITKHVENLPSTIRLMETFEPNLILVEGYKEEVYPKVVMVKDETDRQLLDSCQNVIAVVTWLQPFKAAIPVFSLEEEQDYLSYIINEVRGWGLE